MPRISMGRKASMLDTRPSPERNGKPAKRREQCLLRIKVGELRYAALETEFTMLHGTALACLCAPPRPLCPAPYIVQHELKFSVFSRTFPLYRVHVSFIALRNNFYSDFSCSLFYTKLWDFGYLVKLNHFEKYARLFIHNYNFIMR